MHPLQLAVPFVLAALAAAQGGIRIAKVPEVVRLPAPAGSNLLLEVEVDGAATDVTLGTSLASRDRVSLTAAGDRHWQLNLADARVAALLPAGRDGGELFVFATVGADAKQSAAIAWARATADDGRVRCLVRMKDSAAVNAEPGSTTWIDLAKLERLEVRGASARQNAVVVRAGEFELPLQRRADAEAWVLEGGKTLPAQLQQAAAIEVDVRLGAGNALFAFRAVPTKLQWDGARGDLTLVQRRQCDVPGSRGWLVVDIDDITMAATLLRVRTATGDIVVAQHVVRERDFVEFSLSGDRYVLVVDKLVNLLIGDDYAEMHVQRAQGFTPDAIGVLLRAVEASPDVFLRDGEEWTGATAHLFLLAKVANHRGAPLTVDDFVDKIASGSSKTGEPYQVKKRDGTTVTMQQWLRAQLAAPAPAKAADASPAKK